MSHFTVTVFLSSSAGESEEALTEHLNRVLARYDENREVEPYLDDEGQKTTYNPESKWDWWLIGGRWRGYFLPKEGVDHGHLISGQSGSFGNAPKEFFDESGERRYRVDGGPIELLDLDGMRQEKAKQAELDWDQYQSVTAGTPEPLPWSHFYDRHEGARGAMPKSRLQTIYDAENEVNARFGMPVAIPYDEIPPELKYGPDGEGDGPYWAEWEQAEDRLKGQRLIGDGPDGAGTRHDVWEAAKKVAIQQAGTEWDTALSYSMDQARRDYHEQPRVTAVRKATCYRDMWDDPVQTFEGITRSEYVQRCADRAVPGYATIALDGGWLAPGRMGWFGMSDEDDTSYEMYARAVNKMIDNLPGDTILVVLDCHI